MKEFSVEEKAKANDGNYKAYTELINRLEDVKDAIKKQNYGIAMDILYKPYPEFQVTIYTEHEESEDEGIRKYLSSFVELNSGVNLLPEDAKKMLAWLEKQAKQNLANSAKTCKIEQKPAKWHREDEQNLNACLGYIRDEFLRRWLTDIIHVKYDKPADKDEPKFNIGDIITNGKIIGKVDENEDNKYHGWFGYDKDLSVHYADIPDVENWHKWTIQDVKDGDVLSFNDGHGNDCIELIKSITDKKIEFWFCLTNGNRYEVFDGIIPYTNLVSREDATPATKEQRDILFAKMHEAGYKWDAEKKELKKEEVDNLHNYLYGEQKPAWSEEDEKILNLIIARLHSHKNVEAEEYGKDYHWLKSLKDRVQLKQEWSEEDEEALLRLTSFIEDWDEIAKGKKSIQECTLWSRDEYLAERLLNFLKSIRPQSQWKPSDEQMKALNYVVNLMASSESPTENDYYYNVFKDLKEQLKKLREE